MRIPSTVTSRAFLLACLATATWHLADSLAGEVETDQHDDQTLLATVIAGVERNYDAIESLSGTIEELTVNPGVEKRATHTYKLNKAQPPQ